MKITNNTTNIKQHKCLQKISEIVDKTQLKKKQCITGPISIATKNSAMRDYYTIIESGEVTFQMEAPKSLLGLEVFNKLDITLTANAIAIICENIWKRKNKKVYEGITLKNLKKELLIHELKKH
ncbi:hypothetical protein ACTFIT_011927 [Dictyostelium discoideum]